MRTRTFIFIWYLNEEIKDENYNTKQKKKKKKLDKCIKVNVGLSTPKSHSMVKPKQAIIISPQKAPHRQKQKDKNTSQKAYQIFLQKPNKMKKKIINYKIRTNFSILMLHTICSSKPFELIHNQFIY